MISIATTIEDDRCQFGTQRTLRNESADGSRRLDIAAGFQRPAHRFLLARSAHQGPSSGVINDLSVDVRSAPKDI